MKFSSFSQSAVIGEDKQTMEVCKKDISQVLAELESIKQKEEDAMAPEAYEDASAFKDQREKLQSQLHKLQMQLDKLFAEQPPVKPLPPDMLLDTTQERVLEILTENVKPFTVDIYLCIKFLNRLLEIGAKTGVYFRKDGKPANGISVFVKCDAKPEPNKNEEREDTRERKRKRVRDVRRMTPREREIASEIARERREREMRRMAPRSSISELGGHMIMLSERLYFSAPHPAPVSREISGTPPDAFQGLNFHDYEPAMTRVLNDPYAQLKLEWSFESAGYHVVSSTHLLDTDSVVAKKFSISYQRESHRHGGDRSDKIHGQRITSTQFTIENFADYYMYRLGLLRNNHRGLPGISIGDSDVLADFLEKLQNLGR